MTTKFLATEEVGRLARWLRLMGYDTAIVKGLPRTDLYRKAYNERRIVVTRNRHIGASCLFRVVHLASSLLEEQLQQVVRELTLAIDDERLFTRCDICNVPVEPIERSVVKARVPPYVYAKQQDFYTCPSCQRIYWAATHWHRARALIERLKS
jgi:uncharacterized protein with PIN domain